MFIFSSFDSISIISYGLPVDSFILFGFIAIKIFIVSNRYLIPYFLAFSFAEHFYQKSVVFWIYLLNKGQSKLFIILYFIIWKFCILLDSSFNSVILYSQISSSSIFPIFLKNLFFIIIMNSLIQIYLLT